MFFLWSTATSSSSDLVWPHVFQQGMTRCGGEGPRGAHTAKHQNNMSHSCLMTSTIQPCRALTVHLHPEGSCDMKAIHLFHTGNLCYHIIPISCHKQVLVALGMSCNFSQFSVFPKTFHKAIIFFENMQLFQYDFCMHLWIM